MPGYIGYTPTFEPISLQEYLTVPMMIYENRQKEADKIDDYKDKISYYKSLFGDDPNAKEIFSGYDNMMSQISDNMYNRRTADLISDGRKLRAALRDISNRADLAKTNRDKYQDMLDKDPSLIGEVGSMYDWWKNPDMHPKFVSAKDLASKIGSLTKTAASDVIPIKIISDENSGIDYYQTGINPSLLDSSIANAVSGNISNDYEANIKGYLDEIGYDTLPENVKSRVIGEVRDAAYANSGWGTTQFNRLAAENQRAQTSYHSAQAANAWRDYKDNLPEEWNDLGVVDENGNRLTRNYKYSKKKNASGLLEITRTPIDSKGKAVGGAEPAPYYYNSEGKRFDAVDPASGIYGLPKGSSNTPQLDTQPYVLTTDADGKEIDSDVSMENILDDREHFKKLDANDPDHGGEYNAMKQKYMRKGYTADQIEIYWDDRSKKSGGQKLQVVITGYHQKMGDDSKRARALSEAFESLNQSNSTPASKTFDFFTSRVGGE